MLMIQILFKNFYFKLFSNIDPSASRIVKKAMSEAKDVDADLIIVHLNTYGGTLVDADSIRTAFCIHIYPSGCL